MRILARTLALAIVLTILTVVGCSNQRDRADALTAADRIHSLAKDHDFASVYRESSDDFKEEGDESKFIDFMKTIYESAGALKNIKPIAYQNTVDSNAGKQHVLIFELQFENARGIERLVFTRAKTGEMQLSDIAIEPAS